MIVCSLLFLFLGKTLKTDSLQSITRMKAHACVFTRVALSFFVLPDQSFVSLSLSLSLSRFETNLQARSSRLHIPWSAF